MKNMNSMWPHVRNSAYARPRYKNVAVAGFGAYGLDAGQPDVTDLIAQDISIAGGREYTFVFSSWQTKDALQIKLQFDFSGLATNISVTTQGLTGVTVTMTPIDTMHISDWIAAFAEEGLTDLKSFWAGAPQSQSEIDKNTMIIDVPVLKQSVQDLPKNVGKVVGTVAHEVGVVAGKTLGGVTSGLGMGNVMLIAAGIGIVGYIFIKYNSTAQIVHRNRSRHRRKR
jgi:hypothetical protein